MNRGRRRERVFEDEADYHGFVELLQEAARLWDVGISAYCLMPNHYHLLIHTPLGNLSRCMRPTPTESIRTPPVSCRINTVALG